MNFTAKLDVDGRPYRQLDVKLDTHLYIAPWLKQAR